MSPAKIRRESVKKMEETHASPEDSCLSSVLGREPVSRAETFCTCKDRASDELPSVLERHCPRLPIGMVCPGVFHIPNLQQHR